MNTLREVVICEPVRTPVGGFGGALATLKPADLGAAALRGLLERTGLDPDRIEEVVLGHCYPTSDAPAIGRVVALDAGLGTHVTGMQVDRRCGSGLQAVIQAVSQVAAGINDIVVAGGVESMSNVAFYSTDMRRGAGAAGVHLHDGLARGRETAGGRFHPVPGGMIETAENLRREYGISREVQDLLALESHRRAVAAQESGLLAEEIVPVTVPGRKGDVVVDRDEHPRPDVTLAKLSALRPMRAKIDPDATVTPGNASGQNDAAAMCLVVEATLAERLGLTPLVRLVSWGVAGVEPSRMGIGPVPATERALKTAGLTIDDMDVVELNEAFAAQALACLAEWGLYRGDGTLDGLEHVNPHGSGISLGHPVGATGVRMLGSLARELHRREGRYGLETMCIGGGQGLAAVFERIG
ncbi:acetyl-CoA C-acetyltransferase [Nocardioides yefusunii]|uniref:Probable acetyl-CoA acetyltransferase n=1 Tax=Nocardioides yefusunii TaxID=2500546 RepID=A0ABW1QWD9_9ACTN|nr:acetyl-CoA C-acetyltransferase [Nocardioides yefusunii]